LIAAPVLREKIVRAALAQRADRSPCRLPPLSVPFAAAALV